MARTVAIMGSPVFHSLQEMQGEDRTVWGGAERYMLDLCNLLTREGWEPTIFQQIMPVMKDGKHLMARNPIIKEWRGIKVVCVPVMEQMQDRYGMFPMYNAYFNEIASRADLRIYFVTNMCWPAVVHPCISISHGIYWDHPTGGVYGTGDQRAEIQNRMRETFLAADVCVAVDHNVKNVVRAMFTGAESRIRCIPNYVDTKVFCPGPSPVPNEKPVVLFPRRFTSVRGCNDFVDASGHVPEAHFVACGQADTTASEAAVGTIPSIEYTWVEPEGMPELYRRADIAVVPTKGAEGLSLSLLEAMATGLPIVTTMNGGLGDAVIPGYNALVYDPDEHGCVEEIRTLLHDEVLRKKLGRRAREVAETYDITVWQNNWKKLLRSIWRGA